MDAHHDVTPRTPRYRRRPSEVVERLTGVALSLSIGLAGAILMLTAAGFRLLVISSGSMTPTLHVGDLVVSRTVEATRIHRGDVVTFHDAQLGGELVTHRVLRAERAHDVVDVVTRGDANDLSETWSAPASARVGRTVASLPAVGWAFRVMDTRTARLALLAVVCLGLATAALTRVWAGP